MAAYEGGGGGIGGKFRKRPFRRGPATPYDRPPAASRPACGHPAEPQGSGWLSKLVDPASRIISWSASRLFSSVFQKRLVAPPAPAPEANQKPTEEVLEEHSKSLHEVQGQQPNDEKNVVRCPNAGSAQHGTNPCVDEVSELEELLKPKTFTRIEFDHLTKLLRSRTVEPSTPEVTVKFENKEMANVPDQTNNKQQCAIETSALQPASNFDKKDKAVASEQEAIGIYRLHGNEVTPVSLAKRMVSKEEAASPTEIAKAYMSSKSFKVSPTFISTQNQLLQEDSALRSATPYAKKPFDHSMALSSAAHISEPLEIRSHGDASTKLRGRSAIYKMSLSPYFKSHAMANIGGGKLLVDSYGGPSRSSQSKSAHITHSGGRQTLKRGSSVLDDDIGSFGSSRRTRQKSNLTSPLKSSYPSVGHSLISSSTHVDQNSITSNKKRLLNEQKNNHSELQAIENGVLPLVPIPPQSSEMARKILQQLDKLVPSPKEKSSKLKIDMDESPHMLTHNMLHGRALRSLEEIDTSKFLNIQRSGLLGAPSDSHQQKNSISQNHNKAEENGFTKDAIKGFQVTSTASVLEKSNISGTEAKPSVTTTDFDVSAEATVPTQKKPSFQMSAPEDLDELDDDSYEVKNSSSPEFIVDNKSELISEIKTTQVEKTNLEKSVESSANVIHASTATLDGDPKVSGQPCTEKMNGFLFDAIPDSSSSEIPLMPPILGTSLEKPAPQTEELSVPTTKVGLEAHAFGSPSTVAGSSGLQFDVSNSTTTNVLQGSNSDEVGKTLKSGNLLNVFGNAAPSGLSNSTSSGIPIFGVSATSQVNDGAAPLTSPTSSASVAPAVTLDTSITSGFSTSTGMMPSSAIAISSAAPAFSTISAFQFGTGVSFGASNAVSSIEKSDPANLIGESVTSAALSSTSSNNSVLPTSSVFASMSNSFSAPPSSPLSSTASASSAVSLSSSLSTSSNGFFNFGASPQSTGANSFLSGGSSQNLTTLGTTAGSTFGIQSAQSGSGMSNPLPSSSGTFGSSAPMTMFGLSGTSLSGSASSSFGFSTPATKPLGSSSGFSFSTVTGSSSNSGSANASVPTINFGSSSGFPFSGASVSSLSAGSCSNSLVSTPFGSSSFSFSTGGTSSASLGNNVSFVAGTGTALFSSSSQTSQSSLSGSTFGSTTSSPATGFPFGSSPSPGSSPFTFGASSVPAFSFTSIGSTTLSISPSPAQPMFGTPNQIAGLNPTPGNDQMNIEDSMADDTVQSSVPPVVTFGQPTNIPEPNFMFGSPAAPGGPSTFQFGGQQNNFIPQSSSPFQQAGNLDFPAGGSSFSLGSGGGDKSNRKIVRIRRDKLRKK